jgi:hypothetical protein
MSMSTFLFAADALRIEDGVSWSLVPTLERQPAGKRAVDPSVANRNAQQMAMFTGGMSGLKKKGARR